MHSGILSSLLLFVFSLTERKNEQQVGSAVLPYSLSLSKGRQSGV
jgi:hypothetical protein